MIGRDLVLTAAHCVATGRFLPPNEARIFTDRRVRLGSLLLGRGGETRAIVGMVVHQGYTGQGSGLPNDIALLLLKSDEPVRLGIRSLNVSVAMPTPGADLVGLGWGYTQAVAPGANVLMSMSDQLQHNPDSLQAAPLEVLAGPDCNKRVNNMLKAGMLNVSPYIVITFQNETEVRPYIVLKTKLYTAGDQSPKAQKYFCCEGKALPLTGANGLAENGGAGLKALLTAELETAIRVMLQDRAQPYTRDEEQRITVKGYLPFVGKPFKMKGYDLGHFNDYTLIDFPSGMLVFGGVNIAEPGSLEVQPPK